MRYFPRERAPPSVDSPVGRPRGPPGKFPQPNRRPIHVRRPSVHKRDRWMASDARKRRYGRHTIRAPCWDYPIAARSTATVHRRGSTNTPMECPPKPDQSSTNRARGPALCRSPTDKARPTASYHLHTCRRSARRSQARVTEIRRGNLRLRSASTANQQPGKQHSRFDPSSTLHNSSFKFRLVSIWTLSHAAS
jgi:hypothetical protein